MLGNNLSVFQQSHVWLHVISTVKHTKRTTKHDTNWIKPCRETRTHVHIHPKSARLPSSAPVSGATPYPCAVLTVRVGHPPTASQQLTSWPCLTLPKPASTSQRHSLQGKVPHPAWFSRISESLCETVLLLLLGSFLKERRIKGLFEGYVPNCIPPQALEFLLLWSCTAFWFLAVFVMGHQKRLQYPPHRIIISIST